MYEGEGPEWTSGSVMIIVRDMDLPVDNFDRRAIENDISHLVRDHLTDHDDVPPFDGSVTTTTIHMEDEDEQVQP